MKHAASSKLAWCWWDPLLLPFGTPIPLTHREGIHHISPLKKQHQAIANHHPQPLTSLASVSDAGKTSNGDLRTDLKFSLASASRSWNNARYLPCSSGTPSKVLTSTGRTRLAEDSLMFLRKVNRRGGNEAFGNKNVCDKLYTERKRSLRDSKSTIPC